jgi:hypothetical protein
MRLFLGANGAESGAERNWGYTICETKPYIHVKGDKREMLRNPSTGRVPGGSSVLTFP